MTLPMSNSMHARSHSSTRPRFHVRASVISGVALLATMLSCGGEQAVTNPGTDGSTLFWSLTLDQHAVNLSTVSPYDTAHIVATPRTSDGNVYPNAPAVQYVSSDLEHVQVSADGQLQAIAPGANIAVVATMSVGNLTHSDTVMVDVVSDSVPPVLESFSIHPVPPDSAVWGANALENLTFVGSRFVVAHDDAGNPLSGFSIYFHSSDTTIATIDRSTGELNGKRPGLVTIIASTSAFGVSRADTLPFTITMPAFMAVSIAPPPGTTGPNIVAGPPVATIAAGGTILFIDFNLFQISITFPDPSVIAEDQLVCFCGSGNIDLWGADTVDLNNDFRGRSFPVAGTYVYTVHGGPNALTGTIIVAPPPVSASRVSGAPVIASRAPYRSSSPTRTPYRKVAGGSR
jgi:hypothetical protein